jgi:hypothetical protein
LKREGSFINFKIMLSLKEFQSKHFESKVQSEIKGGLSTLTRMWDISTTYVNGIPDSLDAKVCGHDF